MEITAELTAFRAEMEAVTTSCTFLDHAAVSPLPHRVREAMAHYADCRGVTFGFREEFEEVSTRLRDRSARLIGATPEEIGFVQNTSLGLNIAAQSLPLEPGDNVIFCDMEFPSNVYPWMLLERQRGVEARRIPHDGGGLTLAALERHADDRTRVVTVSSVEFLTGFRTDLEALGAWCRERSIYFVVDGIQSVGAVPLDVRACYVDFLSCGGPKWLMGPIGLGFLYCRQELLERLTPPMAGCVSVVGREDWLDYDLTFLPSAARFELGGSNLVGMVGLLSAVELLLEVGVEAIHARTLHLTDRLIADLERRGYRVASNLDPARRSAIVSFAVPGDPQAAHARLQGAGVAVSLRETYIRVSPHGYNTEDEIARVGQVLGDAG
ncbi:MAG TPA: aminotransferase class V-fold PLP-dependent enzyme [Anaerolineales bacterium]|nr:aminotransferase class V-fold PLP-dependent enzyme [Anaerolineae bacterium]HIQ00573.1 aminotransferase class V-fold PLP-dependent enzyme [Anaerolineales bacterium]